MNGTTIGIAFGVMLLLAIVLWFCTRPRFSGVFSSRKRFKKELGLMKFQRKAFKDWVRKRRKNGKKSPKHGLIKSKSDETLFYPSIPP